MSCRRDCLILAVGLDHAEVALICTLQYGTDCANVQVAAYGCFGKLTCDEMTALASGSVPKSCADLQNQWNATCR